MTFDPIVILNLVKELGGLGLLALVLFALYRLVPLLIAALDRNSRILYRIEGKLGITDTDRIDAPKQ
jgi:hypothetical protein